MPTAFNYAARSDVGMVRKNNQDSGYAGPHLLVVADGMGGHAGGDLASASVIAELFDLDDDAYTGAETGPLLTERVARANSELARLISDDAKLDGMGTTVTAVLRSQNTISIAHIGDSRAYLFRDDEMTQITRDHSFVQTLIDDGRITEEEAATHPQRSFVTRVLTGHEGDNPDLLVRQTKLADRYLLCSDGLTGFVALDTIRDILAERAEPGETADRLVQLSLKAGAPDNVTVVLADVVDVTSSSPPTQPQIVGAAAMRRRKGTRPIPITPAQKAAALAAAAAHSEDGADGDEDGDDSPGSIRLAEQGPRSPLRSMIIILTAAALLMTAAVGGIIAGYQWSQQQYYVGEYEGNVTVFRGVPLSVGPISLSAPLYISEVKTDDLPTFQRSRVAENVTFDDPQAADRLVDDLRRRAAECRQLREDGTPCGTGPLSTPSPTPTTPSPTTPIPTTTLSPATPTLSPTAARPLSSEAPSR